ncbi:DUF3127 domain-containing protein [Prevotella dentasini]|uniref:DUF3127 domain-containing protein n=1 Tax=Prevotella dentasini TaxID=589537 RepID=UPI0004690B52|nr:DUF3127 domain-containing protein [Prevotella dentasini]
MELQGKVIAVLEVRKGTSARGPWESQDYVIETHDSYPRKMVFNLFGADRIAQFAIKAGEEIIVSFDIDAHEYQGRWFNSIRAWNIQRIDATAAQAAAPAAAATPQTPSAGAQAPFPPTTQSGDSNDDLPF